MPLIEYIRIEDTFLFQNQWYISGSNSLKASLITVAKLSYLLWRNDLTISLSLNVFCFDYLVSVERLCYGVRRCIV